MASSARFVTSTALRSLPLAAATAAGAASLWGSNSPVAAGCEAAPPRKPKAFQEATVVSNVPHTRNTRLITLKLPEDWNPSRAPVANVLIKSDEVKEDDGEKPAIRPYNPLSAKSGDEITLLVKRYGDDAKMGSKLHGLNMGDSVYVKGPNRQWTLPDTGDVERYTFLAGGTGVTPIIQAAEGILRKDLDAKVDVFTFNDTPSDVLLRHKLNDLVCVYGNRVRVRNFWGMLDDDYEERLKGAPESKVELMKTTLERGVAYPSKEVLEKFLPKPSDFDGRVMVIVCGPAPMVARVAGPKTKDYRQGELGGFLKDLGFDRKQVWKF